MQIEEQEINLKEFIGLFQRVVTNRWKLILFPSILALVIAYLFIRFLGFIEEPKYITNSFLKVGTEMGQPLESLSSTREIMQSQPILIRIGKRIRSKMTQNDLKRILKSVNYTSDGEVLNVIVTANSPIESFNINYIVTDIIYQRHMRLYDDSKIRLNNLIKTVRESVRPVPLSTGIREFRVEPTIVEVYPCINPQPIENKNGNIFVSVFLVCIIIMVMISFYLETIKKGDQQ